MATFRVGQRVRKVRRCATVVMPFDVEEVPVGAIGTIVGIDQRGYYEWAVAYDGITTSTYWPHCFAFSYMLAPLTDPRCSDFIADMERFAHLADQEAKRIRVLNDADMDKVTGGGK